MHAHPSSRVDARCFSCFRHCGTRDTGRNHNFPLPEKSSLNRETGQRPLVRLRLRFFATLRSILLKSKGNATQRRQGAMTRKGLFSRTLSFREMNTSGLNSPLQHPNHKRNPRKSLKTKTHICNPNKHGEIRKKNRVAEATRFVINAWPFTCRRDNPAEFAVAAPKSPAESP